MVQNQNLRRSHSEKEMLTANMLAMERERAALAYSNAPHLGPLGYRSGLLGHTGLSGFNSLSRLLP
jgi:hypothetical protein